MRAPVCVALVTALVVAGAFGTAGAQVTTGTIFGTVKDDSGGVMPGVTVTVRNVETGVARALVSDEEGRYRAPNLPVGRYEILAELAGFQTSSRSGIELTVGREVDVSFTLSVGSLNETLSVAGEAPLVETTSAQLSDLIDQRQIRELPLNSRSYTDLALLTPGVMTTSRNPAFSGTSGGGIRLSISGARPTNTAFYIDGMDSKDAFGRTPGSAAGTTLGVDTIREFQVLVNNFSAQFGGSGGVLNAVTKSGTNAVHGSGFWFLRSSDLDAKNFFDTLGVPPFRRDQFGFTVGGPVRRNKTFFFASYERLRERRTTTTTINVPGPDLRAGITPTGRVTIHPLTQKYLDAMPLPNGRIGTNGIGEFTTQTPRSADEHYFMAKVDHNLSGNDNVFVRYTSDVASADTPLPFPGFSVPAETTARFLISEYSHIFSPALLNTARVSFNRSDAVLWNESEGYSDDLTLIKLPGRVAPQLVVPGIASFGNRGFDDRAWYLTSLQFAEKLTWVRGVHALAAGMDYVGTKLEGYSASRLHGRVQFNSMNDFLTGVPLTWEFLVPGTGSDPAEGDRGRAFRQQEFAFYIQDDLKLRQNLALNLGVRWGLVDTPTEKNGLISNLRNSMDPVETIGDPFFKPKKNNFGPRLGIAWDPGNDGKTSIRSGFGVFHQPLTYATWQIAAVQNAPYFIRSQIDRPSWPPPTDFTLANLPPGNPTPMEFEPDTPYYAHYNVSVQRQLRGDVVASIAYAGSRGRHLASTQNGNPYQYQVLADGTKFWPAGALPRVNRNYAAIEIRAFDLLSNYNSMQLRLNKRFGSGLQVASSYTWGKNLDNGSETQGTALMDPLDPMRDYGLSDWDVRHSFSTNFIYQLPLFESHGVLGAVVGGWQVSGLLTAVTGSPLRVIDGFNRSRDGNVLSASANNDRPNLVAGANSNPILSDGRDPLKYADVASFELQTAGTHGNLGRNTLIGPGILQFDASFVKNVPLGKERRLELRAEFFNLFNRANFGVPNTTAFTSATGVPNAQFGRITSTSTSARQGQLAVKFLF